MCLDEYELRAACERSFGVKLDLDRESRCPALVLAEVMANLGLPVENSCLPRRMFWHLRAALRHQLRRDLGIRPSTQLSKVMANGEWSRSWRRMRRVSGQQWWPRRPPRGSLVLSHWMGEIREVVWYLARAAAASRESGFVSGRDRVEIRFREIYSDLADLPFGVSLTMPWP
jgi:hypothetical protein